MALLIKKTIRGSTLLESLVAMVILMTIIAISSMLYVNVLKSDSHRQKLHAQLLMTRIQDEAFSNSLYLDTDITERDVRVHKSITPYTGYEHLYVLKLVAYTKENEAIGEQFFLISKNE